MIFKSKIKWAAVIGLVLSLFSLLVHLLLAKFSNVNIVQYSAMAGLSEDFASKLGTGGIRYNKKLWGVVNSAESLQPYANTRGSYPGPNEQSNGFIYAKIFGGFANIRSSICDLVTISRLLNATLVIPEIQESIRSKGISSKFKSFSYLYNEEQFIASLTNDVIIVKSLPEKFKVARKRNEFPTFRPKNSASPSFYIEKVLPTLKRAKVIGLLLSDGGCLQSILPPSMSEYQRLRCRVAFHALHFRPEIQVLGRRIVERLRGWGRPFLAFHPGLVRDTLAYHGCAELFQDVHTELIQYRRAQMIKQGIVKEELNVDSHMRKANGSCPLMPEEVGILLRTLGYPPKTIIYLAGSETFGGQRILIPLRAMFPNLVDRSTLCSKPELSDLTGPETTLPLDFFQSPPAKSEEQLKEEWKKAGPRPRPLPPPPGRPIYRHEKEGWYGWITETDTEPGPSPMNLRMQAHRLLWDALDYIVSVEADAFFPGFNNDGSGWPDFSNLVMGQRLYGIASSRTYRPDRKILAELLNQTRDNMYHPKVNWTLTVREHLNKSLGRDGLIRESLLSKPISFLSHPLPECSCRISSAEDQVKGDDGRFLYGGEDTCPEWMQRDLETVSLRSAGAGVGKVDETDSSDYENAIDEQQESDDSSSKAAFLSLDQDEEMDPND
ncbi:protein EMBRYO SAC DEVELOPMENT ARREST 30 [Malania oleifera]|uniref:protein EMBRYO SAC DEVELOPMENT ARREST 30 n=1 Tax=Malania oleifera TaxID=397392 RepID=UPI0025AE5C28|nr:protein EMBRYO SAC DEVELOPMENT ARREST 30 [Malania oleifera]